MALLNKALTQKQSAHARALIRGGAGVNKLKKVFEGRMEKQWQARRLLRTEQTKIQSQNFTKEATKEGLKQYAIVAQPSACPVCKRQTGLHRLGGQMPPYHPNCRCSAH